MRAPGLMQPAAQQALGRTQTGRGRAGGWRGRHLASASCAPVPLACAGAACRGVRGSAAQQGRVSHPGLTRRQGAHAHLMIPASKGWLQRCKWRCAPTLRQYVLSCSTATVHVLAEAIVHAVCRAPAYLLHLKLNPLPVLTRFQCQRMQG